MKPVTVDMLRAHLMAASLTAMGAEFFACVALLILPATREALSSTSFRLLAVGVIVGGVMVIRHVAQVAFYLAQRSRHAMPGVCPAKTVSIAADCPRRQLVILHLRFTGTPFVLAGR
jgi:hypothetical protein